VLAGGPLSPEPRVVIPAVLAIVVLIGGGIFAAVKVSQRHNPTASAPPAAPPNTGPFTGTYRADYGPITDLDGKPVEGATPLTATWGVRSVCRSSGCVATASHLSGPTPLVSTLVFDDVGGRWMAVGLGSDQCNNVPAEYWGVYTLQPRPDGTLAGGWTSTASNACGIKRAVTFTRTGDVDVNSLPDPASQPPRVVSPAEALHGHYHLTRTSAVVTTRENDLEVRTDCLRTRDRCMSYFHGPILLPLVFGSGHWIWDVEFEGPCPAGGTGHTKITGEFSLPMPSQDPITLLSGHSHQVVTGSACVSADFDDKSVRTGD
jgi:hypothetical protein